MVTVAAFFAIASTVGWVGSVILVLTYHHIARWWDSPYGRALFLLILVTVSFFTTSMLYNVFGSDYPGRTLMRVVNLLLNVGMVWYLLVTLLRGRVAAQRQRRKERASGPDQHVE